MHRDLRCGIGHRRARTGKACPRGHAGKTHSRTGGRQGRKGHQRNPGGGVGRGRPSSHRDAARDRRHTSGMVRQRGRSAGARHYRGRRRAQFADGALVRPHRLAAALLVGQRALRARFRLPRPSTAPTRALQEQPPCACRGRCCSSKSIRGFARMPRIRLRRSSADWLILHCHYQRRGLA